MLAEIESITDGSFIKLLESYEHSKKIILCDENTHKFCASYLITSITSLAEAEIIQIPAGEDSKDLEIAAGIWAAFTEYGITRKDLVINLTVNDDVYVLCLF